MAKGATSKAQHMVMKPIEGPGFSFRGFRHAPDNCECGGVLVYVKIARVKGGERMGLTCAGREALKRKGWFATADGKTPGAEITEEQFRKAKAKADLDKTDAGVMEAEVVVREELKSCGQIFGRGKGNRFGAA